MKSSVVSAAALSVLMLGALGFGLPAHAATVPLVNAGDGWLYRKGSSAPQADWKTADDAALDGTWLGPAPGGFGYGDNDDATILGDMMGVGGYTTLYIRKSFVVTEPLGTNQVIQLTADWDDAFVAYLDGVEIHRSPLVPTAAGVEPTFNTRATGTHEASGIGSGSDFNLGPVGSRLDPGTHILSVLGLNESTGSSDFSLIISLASIDAPVPPIPPIVSASDDWRYFKGTAAPVADWQSIAEASLPASWLTGPGGFGYGDGDDATVLNDMQNNYTTVYIRRTFNIASEIDTNLHAFLNVDYDDGFVAYLDGFEVARRNVAGSVGVEPDNTGVAATDHEASSGSGGEDPVSIDLGQASNRLSMGDHILALIGLNDSADSSDLSLIPSLTLAVPPPPSPGDITMDTTWTVANSPYNFNAEIVVQDGVTLTIEPGVHVLFNSGRGMTVRGRLLAMGTPEEPIVFDRSGTSGTWNQINFTANNTTSVVTHAYISYFGNSALEANGTALHLDSIVWTNSTQQAVDLVNSSITLLNSFIPGGAGNEPLHFSNMPANGHALIKGCIFGAPQGYNDSIDFTGGNRPGPIAEFIDNIFLASVDDCFDMDATDAHIEGNIFMNVLQDDERTSSSNPITTGEGNGTSELVICRNIFYNCEHTLLLKDSGSALMQNNTIVHLVTNALARTAPFPSGMAIPPGIILFGEPWRGRPLGAGAIYEGNIAYDLDPLIQTDPFPYYDSNQQFFDVSRSLIQNVNWPGEGNLSTDPMFVNLTFPMTHETIKSNLMLLAGSPCIGTGPNGLDMGALVPAGASVSGEPEGVTTNRSALLRVAGPGIYAYKWKLNDGPWSDETPLTTDILITPSMFDNAVPITLTNLADGDYTVYIVGKNSAGSWQSTNAPTVSKTWTVSAADLLRIGAFGHDGSTFTLQFTAQPGQSYTIQYRDSLTTGDWQKLVDIPAPVMPDLVTIPDSPADQGSRFYRIVSPSQP